MARFAPACAAWVLAAVLAEAGDSYRVAWMDVTVTRPDGGSFPARVAYPAVVESEGGAPAVPGVTFPAISFGHGYLGPPQLYDGTLEHLASRGYIVIATSSGLELFPDHAGYGEDLLACLRCLEEHNTLHGSPLCGRVRVGAYGLLGHSMGGGAAFLAAAADSGVRAVAAMAPAETRPSARAAAASVTAPKCIIAASEDRIAPPKIHALPIYASASPPKDLEVIDGGSHCGFLDVEMPDAVCDEGTISRESQLAETRSILVAFFQANLGWGGRGFTRLVTEVARDNLRGLMAGGAVAQGAVSMSPPFLRKEVSATEAAEFEVSLTNEGDAPDRYTLSLSGECKGAVVQPAETTPVMPGQCVGIKVRMEPGSGPHARWVVTLLRAESTTDPGVCTEAMLSVLREEE